MRVARVRAAESRRADALFRDDLAAAFVRAATADGQERPASRTPSRTGLAMAEHVVLRTRFFDDYLTAEAASGTRQVVLVAAGLDTRAFRLDWPEGTRLFEVDLPEVLAFKERVLAAEGAVAVCERHTVAADLREPWGGALAAAGFEAGAPTAWLVEGLLAYLRAEDAAAVLEAVGELSAPGSALSLSYGAGLGRLVGQSPEDDPFQQVSDLFQGGLDEPADTWLSRHGWQVSAHPKTALAASYGRAPAYPSDASFLVARRPTGAHAGPA